MKISKSEESPKSVCCLTRKEWSNHEFRVTQRGVYFTFFSAWHLLNEKEEDQRGARRGFSRFIAALGNRFRTNPL